MKKNLLLFVSSLFILPGFALAQIAEDGSGGDLGLFMITILGFIQEIIIPFILSIGFLVFLWGIFLYFIRGGADPEAQKSGKSLILYAIGGFVIILAFWGIVNIITDGIGLENERGNIESPNIIPRPGN